MCVIWLSRRILRYAQVAYRTFFPARRFSEFCWGRLRVRRFQQYEGRVFFTSLNNKSCWKRIRRRKGDSCPYAGVGGSSELRGPTEYVWWAYGNLTGERSQKTGQGGESSKNWIDSPPSSFLYGFIGIIQVSLPVFFWLPSFLSFPNQQQPFFLHQVAPYFKPLHTALLPQHNHSCANHERHERK